MTAHLKCPSTFKFCRISKTPSFRQLLEKTFLCLCWRLFLEKTLQIAPYFQAKRGEFCSQNRPKPCPFLVLHLNQSSSSPHTLPHFILPPWCCCCLKTGPERAQDKACQENQDGDLLKCCSRSHSSSLPSCSSLLLFCSLNLCLFKIKGIAAGEGNPTIYLLPPANLLPDEITLSHLISGLALFTTRTAGTEKKPCSFSPPILDIISSNNQTFFLAQSPICFNVNFSPFGNSRGSLLICYSRTKYHACFPLLVMSEYRSQISCDWQFSISKKTKTLVTLDYW